MITCDGNFSNEEGAFKPLHSVIVSTHNRCEVLNETLQRLAKQRLADPWELIVVNNNCTDDTDIVVQQLQLSVPTKLIHETTPGVAAARNAGAEAAAGAYLVFLDDDILVEPDFLQRHRDALSRNPDCWIQGQVVNLPEQEQTSFGRFRKSLFPVFPPDQEVIEAWWFAGANASMPRAHWQSLGGFDQGFSIASVEDYDIAIRAWKRGIRILVEPGIVGVHNDWAGFTIRDYCRRQRIYSRAEPLFLEKWGEDHPRPQLVRDNLPPAFGQDSPRLLVRKLLKQFVGLGPVQECLFRFCEVLERLLPSPRLLWPTYRLLLAASIYRGIQEGMTGRPEALTAAGGAPAAPAA
jgi:GT2 family glycosyltransferase